MKKIFRLSIIALYSALLISCAAPSVPTELNVTTTELTFSNGKESRDISFTTNKDWTAVSSAQWAKVPASGTSSATSLTVEVDENTDYEDRTAVVTIKADDISRSIIVKQSTNIGLIVTQTGYIIDGKSQTIEIEVRHNIEFEVLIDESCKSWITLSDTKALSTSSVKFNIARNESTEDRTGEITFNQKGGTLSEVVTVKQAKISTEFDEAQIAFSFGMLSDTHINGANTENCEDKLRNAFAQLKAEAAKHDANGLDGVVVDGDLIDYGAYLNSQLPAFKSIYENAFNPETTPLVYTIGNHDPNSGYWWNASVYQFAKSMRNVFGSKYEKTDTEVAMRDAYECRHCIIGDYHFLCVTPNSQQPISYPSAVIDWLDKTLNDITTADPERYVIVLTHPMIYDTVYGSLLGPGWMTGTLKDQWSTSALTPTLKKYPQVMTFGGHLHFPINDPRSIWQGDFTAFGCGSTRYMAIEDGRYENMSGTTTMSDRSDISSGLLLQFDVNGNARITKMFFSQNTTFGDPWELSRPLSSKNHLAKYNTGARKATNTAPTLSTLDVQKNGTAYKVTFAAGQDDEFVHHYILTLKKDGSVIATKRILSDFYRNANPSGMKSKWEVSFSQLNLGEYELELVAEDSWGATSVPLTKKFVVDNKKTWAMYAKFFDKTSGSSTAAVTNSYCTGLTFTDYAGENGNNVLIKGLFLDAEVEGKVEKNGDKITKVGIYVSSKRFYKADAGRYCVLLPECSAKGYYWSNYNLFPYTDKAFSDKNYDWLWFTADSSGAKAQYIYDQAGQISDNGKYIYLGLSFGWATQSEITSTEYVAVYQANYNGQGSNGMWLDLPSD